MSGDDDLAKQGDDCVGDERVAVPAAVTSAAEQGPAERVAGACRRHQPGQSKARRTAAAAAS